MTSQSAQGPVSGPTQFVDGLNSAIRENPVAAGLVGLGVLWMFFGNAKVSSVASSLAGSADDALSATSRGAANRVRSAGETAENYASEVAHKMSETAQQVSEAIEKRAHLSNGSAKMSGQDVAAEGRQRGKAVQQNLSLTIERQPLMLGVVGLGIGAAIASMFSATDLERNLMGETGARAKEKIKDIVSETAERAGQVVDDVKKEAIAQGLTAASVEASATAVVEKIGAVAAAGKDSIFKVDPKPNFAPNS
jgi:hypothetical protein